MKTGILQHVTRRRRKGEEIPFPDCYDEFIGRESTGRIIRFLGKGKYEEVFLDDENKPSKEDKIKNLVEELSTLVGIEQKTEIEKINSKLITIIHDGGITEYIVDYDFDIDEYKIELDTKFWKDFVKDIQITDIP